ncbi:hypothetical protein [Sporosarcina sp. P20a]|uniref:hypothetical protein n=1 Tax=Sporosarcina sp. P20a TaxID=2048256 RepID=UPI001304662D|nr:hypothetical protein [Sporosarcina sp. P20a]
MTEMWGIERLRGGIDRLTRMYERVWTTIERITVGIERSRNNNDHLHDLLSGTGD